MWLQLLLTICYMFLMEMLLGNAWLDFSKDKPKVLKLSNQHIIPSSGQQILNYSFSINNFLRNFLDFLKTC